MSKSMVETAYQVLQTHQDPVPFVQLWTEVSKEMGFTPHKRKTILRNYIPIFPWMDDS